jgi:hypothetical protein
MSDLYMKAVLAGLFFGIWPLLMNKSRLGGNISSVAFCVGVFIVVSPFAIRSFNQSALSNIDWKMVVAAVICGGIGLLSFNGMLAKAILKNVSSLFVVALVVQIAVPALYQVYLTRGISPTKGLGFAAAAISAFLLLRN